MAIEAYDILKNRIVLKGYLQLLTGLHIGCGRETEVGASDSPIIKDFLGRPFIPGSSFKGVLRSSIESLLRSFSERNEGYLACNITDAASLCITNNRKKEIVKGNDPDRQIWEESCWTCRLFGSPWLASRLNILDMPLGDKEFRPEWISIRDGVVIDRETETAAKGGKYDFEAVPAHTRFKLEIMLENPEEYHMGLVVMGLDFLNKGITLLGGNKSRGLGRVKIILEEIQEITPRSILEGLGPPPKEDEDMEREKSIDQEKEDFTEGKEETIQGPEDLVLKALGEGKLMEQEALVQVMKEAGWGKEHLQQIGYKNYRALFLKMVEEKQLDTLKDNQYKLAGGEVEDLDKPQEVEEEEKLDEEIEEKLNKWRRALRKKLEEEFHSTKGGMADV